ncbi:diphthine--ammonia ligase [Flavobacterium cerinum]|uniref:Diphthine--ammonia ligase n=1 Tax=Flavobacterium cerinum TaxID=2502784 RepID=A0ABY5IPS6_9FLAO|nr:diphthine--ammonia ligase [Flavobacterium cerinum]UUC44848.1 diphthine--ammonia ligase [Flavobacterium cerinum]
MKAKTVFNWSSGKDSALALYELLQHNDFEIDCLLTSISKQYDRISMHGVRSRLLEQQTESIGIPLVKMEIPEMPSMEVYENVMRETLTSLKAKGITHAAFGDIFLEDLRKYREEKLAEMDLKAVFPLWKRDTSTLIQEFIGLGFKTIVTCVDARLLDKSFVGRIIDADFLRELPENVDPCGENGEFHTFTFDGPLFKKPVAFTKGEIVLRKYEAPKNDDSCFTDPKETQYGFWYCDLIPE